MSTTFALAILIVGASVLYFRLRSRYEEEPSQGDYSGADDAWDEVELSETEQKFWNFGNALKQAIYDVEESFSRGILSEAEVSKLENKFLLFRDLLPEKKNEPDETELEALPPTEQIGEEWEIEKGPKGPGIKESEEKKMEGEMPASGPGPDALVELPEKKQPSQEVERKDPSHHFVTEVMLSAGPRKWFSSSPMEGDTDLGEDVAGFVQSGEQLLFWVLDGSSDAPVIRATNGADLFSSRHLAHTLGFYIARQAQGFGARSIIDPQALFARALEQTHIDWSQQLDQLDGADRLMVEGKLADAPQTCSTTVLIGIFTKKGQLNAYRIGDSFLLPFGQNMEFLENSLAVKPKGRLNSRLFFRMTGEGLLLEHNSPAGEALQLEGVGLIIGATDGLGRTTMALLQQHLRAGEENIRKMLIGLPQRTEDDKTILFSRLIGHI
ncbi:MAG: hypothetical protein H6566_24590 [Lewinellaceae bacterium]|nr:hypothetical protein [Lewinellaceae bacterium]